MDIKNIDKGYYVYLLTNTHNNKTYLGITNKACA